MREACSVVDAKVPDENGLIKPLVSREQCCPITAHRHHHSELTQLQTTGKRAAEQREIEAEDAISVGRAPVLALLQPTMPVPQTGAQRFDTSQTIHVVQQSIDVVLHQIVPARPILC